MGMKLAGGTPGRPRVFDACELAFDGSGNGEAKTSIPFASFSGLRF